MISKWNSKEEEKQNKDNRYKRLRLIDWWDQEKIQESKVMVVGAGAIGNEVIKNLALIGIGKIVIIDFDSVEISNLTRSILFSGKDLKKGNSKSWLAAKRVKEINPDVEVQYINGDIEFDVGLGVISDVDLVFCCLDNIRGRWALNRMCWKMGKKWINAGISTTDCEISIYEPGNNNPCYECSMNDISFENINKRFSCTGFKFESLPEKKIPTTSTIASIAGAFQVQEGLKIIDGCKLDEGLEPGDRLIFDSKSFNTTILKVQPREDCLVHDIEIIENVININKNYEYVKICDIYEKAEEIIGGNLIVELDRDILISLVCNNCSYKKYYFKIQKKLTSDVTICPKCGSKLNENLKYTINKGDELFFKSLKKLGFPRSHIYTCSNKKKSISIRVD